ncbi:MAG: hypothetical protein E7271_00135 [Lachnospiraceae bacterium]|jgi:hypothetical protein|nr:hypothetical protein [Lachnospiraceae bacterium]
MNNKGSATVEACIALPLFLFFLLFVYLIGALIYSDACIHQSLCDAAVESSKYCYLESRIRDSDDVSAICTGVLYTKFQKYIEDEKVVDKVVAGGRRGIIVTTLPDTADKKVFIANASYIVNVSVPVIGSFAMPRNIKVKQKAFLGYGKGDVDEADYYVYVTPNESVYHLSRGCSHLNISIQERSSHGSLKPCAFCMNKKKDKGKFYVAKTGDVYHTNPDCLGLKRTVMRVRKSSVAGLGPCSRCGR